MTRAVERDETDVQELHELLLGMVADGDGRAATAGRRARRTLQEMVPGHVRQPVLILHRPLMTGSQQPRRPRQGADDVCPLCEFWRCRCDEIFSAAPAAPAAPVRASGDGQCSTCGMWFQGWNGGVCDACRAICR
ncbi:hypothetical protein [Streptomyces flavofungini]|uniref:hypothetical protein n=1 Tax=Streptomyces flavofungini TaxID=68200 RepID=UPI0025AF6305|nr:hypothetical protein [Streptomyces flavofungini]WJV51814.1 hypothetical protein QUY26_40615 [Streptomyces flavofungini]WJV51837.1 hypothetical protein QUY26_40730 [Streptomyces flavofungini]